MRALKTNAHEFADPAEYNAASEFLPPEEILEPEDLESVYREASIKYMAIVLGCIQYLREAKSDQELRLRLDVFSLFFNHPNLNGKSLVDLAVMHKKTRAAISAQILIFQRSSALSPAFVQKSVKSRQVYGEKRKSKLQ